MNDSQTGHELWVASRPTAGMDQAYNAWYNDVHISEVSDLDGFVSARRLSIVDGVGDTKSIEIGIGDYLTAYQLSGDYRAAIDSLNRAVRAGTLGASDAIDMKSVRSLIVRHLYP